MEEIKEKKYNENGFERLIEGEYESLEDLLHRNKLQVWYAEYCNNDITNVQTIIKLRRLTNNKITHTLNGSLLVM